MPAVEMQVNIAFEFIFMLSITSATDPPQPTCSPLPRFDEIACHAAVWSKCENNESGRGTELACTCALVAGAISVPVFATIAARPALNRFCRPVKAGLRPKVRPVCGVFSVIGRISLRG